MAIGANRDNSAAALPKGERDIPIIVISYITYEISWFQCCDATVSAKKQGLRIIYWRYY